jgi:hypothetical protein
MTFPNFLIIGAPKSGTSSLYNYLQQHPDIFMSSVKEPHFFVYQADDKIEGYGPGDRNTVQRLFFTDPDRYHALFKEGADKPARGEASAMYIYYPVTPLRIKDAIPDVKLIAVLRNPVERAHSSYLHMVREGRETCASFEAALQEEEARIQDDWLPLWHYKKMGFYHEQLERYYDAFDASQIRIYLFEDFESEPLAVMQDIFRYLGVDDAFVPDMTIRHNITGVPKNKMLHRLHHFLKKPHSLKAALKPMFPQVMRRSLKTRLVAQLQTKNLHKPSLAPEVRQGLIDAYRPDIAKLQTLLQRDLSHWLE